MGYIRNGYAKSKPLVKKLKVACLCSVIGFFSFTFLWVLALKWLPVYVTPLVVIRTAEYALQGKWVKVQKDWVSIEEISPHLQHSVIASEDPKFLEHKGFDFEAIARALATNKNRKVKMGASTISQQTAKNVFLYPSRTYFRKGLEAYFTVLIENIWDKKRILEVYLNVIELGPGIYGAEAAALHYWKKPSQKLSLDQAQLFAAVLPNPRRWSPKAPTNFVLRRKNFIRRNLGIMGKSYFSLLASDS
jgi:monofunctional biosynthetic peptidoglycan transglycosylase